MTPKDLITLLIVDVAVRSLLEENQQLREHAAGYDRLRSAYDRLKAASAAIDPIEHARIKLELANAKSFVFRLEQDVAELGRENIALAAEAERGELAEQQLAVAESRICELNVALLLSCLPAKSRDNVIQMVREAA